jgi:ABC-2 type transport system ATP-binding protein
MLEIRNLVKHFGPLVAVDGVSFTVPRGEVLGFLGPNGAGKSTTMKMIAGFVAPTAGTAVICGDDILDRPLAAKRHLGYLPEGAPAYPDMIVADFLGFIAAIRGLSGRERTGRLARAIEMMRIGEVLDQPIETLSKGFQRRVGVAQALLHDPPVLILDEPTDGLDPNQKYEMRSIIRAMQPEKAIVISTHLLEEVEAVCSRAIIIARGRILADGAPAELAARSPRHNAAWLKIAAPAEARIRAELARLPGVASVEKVHEGDDAALLVYPHDRRPIAAEIADFVREQGAAIGEWRIEQGRLDDVFRAITAPAAETADPETVRAAA